MDYIPQEAKEQIASLMGQVDKLEEDKRGLIDQIRNKSENQEDNKTIVYALLGVLAVVLIVLLYTYMFGPVFGKYKTQLQEGERLEIRVKDLEKKQSESNKEIIALKGELSKAKIDSELLYRVQIGAYKRFKLGMYGYNIASIKESQNGGFNKYSIGIFTTYKEALAFKKEVKRMGIRTAFLVAEYKGKSITITDAIKKEKSKK